MQCSALGLGQHPQIRLHRLPTLWEQPLGFLIGHRRTDDHVISVFPVGRSGDPVLGGQLQRVDDPQDFIEVATSRSRICDGQFYFLVRSDDEHAAHRQGVIGIGVNHVVEIADSAIGVTNHGEIHRRTLSLGDVAFPFHVTVHRVYREADDFDVALVEFGFDARHVSELGCTDRSEVPGMAEQNSPGISEPIVERDLSLGGVSGEVGSNIPKAYGHGKSSWCNIEVGIRSLLRIGPIPDFFYRELGHCRIARQQPVYCERRAMEIDTLAGLPAHPLFVHIPVIVVPMAAIAAGILAIFPRFIGRWVWWVAGLAGVGALGAVLTAGSGEALEERIEETALVERHTELGELARAVSIALFAVLVVVAVTWRFVSGKRIRTAVASVVMLGAAAGAVGTIAAAGHSGAESVWSEVVGSDEAERTDDQRDDADRNDPDRND